MTITPDTTLTIIIPMYNEASTIVNVLDKISEVKLLANIKKQIVIVDDCSSDNCGVLVSEYIKDETEGNLGAMLGGMLGGLVSVAIGSVPQQQDPKRNWIPDAATNVCLLCNKTFTMLTRKHHCRHCGRVVCGACSKHRTKHSEFQTESNGVRTCDRCVAGFKNAGFK